MNILECILQQMSGISQSQKKFMVIFFSTILLVYGKVNFTNLSRYSSLSEKTYRRHGSPEFVVINKPHILTPRASQNREQLCLIPYLP
jgi:hypothetical protein